MEFQTMLDFWLYFIRIVGGFTYVKGKGYTDAKKQQTANTTINYVLPPEEKLEKTTDAFKKRKKVNTVNEDANAQYEKSQFWTGWSKGIIIFDFLLVSSIPVVFFLCYFNESTSKTLNIAEGILMINETVCLVTITVFLMRKRETLVLLVRKFTKIIEVINDDDVCDDAFLKFSLCVQTFCLLVYVAVGISAIVRISCQSVENPVLLGFIESYNTFLVAWKLTIVLSPMYLFYGMVKATGLLLFYQTDALSNLAADRKMKASETFTEDKSWEDSWKLLMKDHIVEKSKKKRTEKELVVEFLNLKLYSNKMKYIDLSALQCLEEELLQMHYFNELLIDYFSSPLIMVCIVVIVDVLVCIFSLTVQPKTYCYRGVMACSAITILISLCHAPDYYDCQRDRLRLVLVRMQLLTKDEETSKEIQNILALMNEYHGFDMGRFFVLAKARLVEILGFVATYIVILHQFQASENQLGVDCNDTNLTSTFSMENTTVASVQF